MRRSINSAILLVWCVLLSSCHFPIETETPPPPPLSPIAAADAAELHYLDSAAGPSADRARLHDDAHAAWQHVLDLTPDSGTGRGALRQIDAAEAIFRGDETTTPVDAIDDLPSFPAGRALAVFRPRSPYPLSAALARMAGTVELEVVIDESGSVSHAEVIRSLPVFDKFALATVSLWRFKPGGGDGKSPRWKTRLSIHYSPRDENPCADLDMDESPTAIDIEQRHIFPVALSRPKATYPRSARKYGTHFTGDVCIGVVVDPSGDVSIAKVLVSQPPFDGPALAAVKRWRYQPLIIEGKPVEWKGVVNYHFRLKPRKNATSLENED